MQDDFFNTVLAKQIKQPLLFVLVLPRSILYVTRLGATPNRDVEPTILHLILKIKGIYNGLHTNSSVRGRLTCIFDKTSWSVALCWAHYCFPAVSVVVLVAHLLCFSWRTQPLKEVMIPVFFFFGFSFNATGLCLQLWWFNLVILLSRLLFVLF